ncbi:protease complex subunit PrcB family protein [Flavobacterium antarcticum]
MTDKSKKASLVTTIYTSQYQGRESESNIIIDNQKDLVALFKSVGAEEMPNIDFSKNQVVALFLGTKSTGGFRISIDRVEESEGKIYVFKKIETPKADEMVTMALTNPFVIAEIHSKKEIVFE